MKYLKAILLCIVMAISAISCNDADNYYEHLHNQPEVVTDYKMVYSVGDTLVLKGRLNPENGLHIRIGDAEAGIISFEKITQVNDMETFEIDQVRIIITEAMGIGTGRQVSIVSNNITITAPAIEIVGNSDSGILDSELELTNYAALPANAKTIYCRSGSGHVYYWEPIAKKLVKLLPDGTSQDVFLQSNASDSFGNLNVQEFNAGGIDPEEKYFYFSARVREIPSVPNNEIYKLCRWDMQTQQFTVLNRTLYPTIASQRTLASAQPFEGQVNQVKIYKVTGIFPDSEGNVYMDLMSHFLTRLDATGSYTYHFDTANRTDHFIPAIRDEQTGTYYGGNVLHQMLPGVSIPLSNFTSIDAGQHLLFGSTVATPLLMYDLVSQSQVFQIRPNWYLNVNFEEIPYLTASFDVITGPSGISQQVPGAFGYFPMPGQKLIVLMYQDLGNTDNEHYLSLYSQYKLPALQQLDFAQRKGERYAPGKLRQNGFIQYWDDEILNYDADGMLYMTANHKTAIVKTKYIN